MNVAAEARFVSPWAHALDTLWGTALASLRRNTAYLIEIIRTPLFPLVYFGTTYLAYTIAGRATVDGSNVAGFLLVGMFGLLAWESSVWSSGSAIENERYEGAIGALFMTPANRALIVAGYGLGGFLFLLPALAMVGVIGVVVGARLTVSDPLAVVATGLALLIASLAAGFALAGFFVLTRRANLMANVIQHPIQLLGGFVVARDDLPRWLRPLADAVPFSHATDALRAATLRGATLGDVAGEVAWTLALSAVFALAGAALTRRVEHAAKRSGQLDLF